MKWLSLLGLLVCEAVPANQCPEHYNQNIRKLHSQETLNLCDALYGKTVLVVNTASKCGFTPQFSALEALYQEFKNQDFVVIGFPSNDFFQDSGTEKETANVCHLNYGVTFPMMMKSSVKGANANLFYQSIIADSGVSPRWNFHKYLLNDKGQVIGAFPSSVKPNSPVLKSVITQALSL